MKRNHLRVVTSQSAPCHVTHLGTFSFHQADGDLIILHNDNRVTPRQALIEIMKLIQPALENRVPPAEPAIALRRILPGEIGGCEMIDQCDDETVS